MSGPSFAYGPNMSILVTAPVLEVSFADFLDDWKARWRYEPRYPTEECETCGSPQFRVWLPALHSARRKLGRAFYVQVGAFSEPQNARELANTLEAAGYRGVFIDSDGSRIPPLHRVRIGPFARSDNIDDVVDGLSAVGLDETQLVVEY